MGTKSNGPGNGQASTSKLDRGVSGVLAKLRIDSTTPLAELLTIRDRAHQLYFTACQFLATRQAHELPGIQRARAFIEQHFTEPLTRDDVAPQAGLCPQQFSRRFKQTTGRTLAQFLTRRRVAYAQQLLVTTDHNITAIALDVGFGTESTFYRAFRRLTGCTATQYRRRARRGRRRRTRKKPGPRR